MVQQKGALGEQFVEAGMITAEQLELAQREQQRSGGRLGPILVQLGFVAHDALAEFLGRKAGTKAVKLSRITIDPGILSLVPTDVARRCLAIPIARENGSLTVAIADPFDVMAVDMLQQISGLHINVVTASELDILNYLEIYYSTGDSIGESIDKILDEKDRQSTKSLDEALNRMANKDEDAPVIRVVRQIITRAVNNRASDIHFEPEERMVRVRTRVDGVLYQDILIPKAMQSPVITRMKILADLDLAEKNVPQDGRASIIVGGRQVILRVSSLPTCYGENIVARILDPTTKSLALGTIGFAPDVLEQFRTVVNEAYGVLLVAGPTGSGKSTTLYAVLNEISTMEVSTFTLEDPIEYRMTLVRQTQINEDMGLTFSSGLRALLRQDPDIILVGETRDTETAQLMIRAALTGHMVLSTLHTNDAAGAIPRLVDMGVEPYLLPAALLGVLAQRLVRGLCEHCREELPNPAEVFEKLKLSLPGGHAPMQLWRGNGCPVCKQTGYKGRRGIFELMVLDERFHDPIVHRAGAPEYQRLAREKGMRTMFEDGMIKAARGITTVEELMRETRLTPS
jgi:type II secretory ATPase GspE/PulE/Tfp pilus assembly ATPase PilB-like protein